MEEFYPPISPPLFSIPGSIDEIRSCGAIGGRVRFGPGVAMVIEPQFLQYGVTGLASLM
jgi:hypothetical protein